MKAGAGAIAIEAIIFQPFDGRSSGPVSDTFSQIAGAMEKAVEFRFAVKKVRVSDGGGNLKVHLQVILLASDLT